MAYSDPMQFLGYAVDDVHRAVTKPDGRVVRLERKAFDLLQFLAAHPNETMSREQLIAGAWNGKSASDDAVPAAVDAIRLAFDDDARSPRFVETIPARGFRWIAGDGAIPPAAGTKKSVALISTLVIVVTVAAIGWSLIARPPRALPAGDQAAELVREHARGLFFSEQKSARDLSAAQEEFRKAIEADDRLPEPHAALAETCVRLIEVGSPDPEKNELEARKEAARAVALAPNLAISHAALASVEFMLDREPAKAERSFRHAIELDPKLPAVHRRYSYLLDATGRFEEGIAEARTGAGMEPTSAPAVADLAWAHFLAGHYAEAERLYHDALRLDPANIGVLLSLGYCYEIRNAPADAMRTYRRALEIRGLPESAIAEFDRTYAAGGLPGVYEAWFQHLRGDASVPRTMLAFYAIRAGRPAEAMGMLTEAARRNEPGTLWIAVHPAYASLRGRPEFAAVVAASLHTR